MAALLYPIHFSDFDGLVLWACGGDGEFKRDGQLKCGVTRLTTIQKIQLPVIPTERRVKFAILCAKKVCADARWNAWADRWLSGEDRSREAAESAWVAAESAMNRETEAAAEAALAAISKREIRSARAAWSAVRLNGLGLDLIAIAEEACK